MGWGEEMSAELADLVRFESLRMGEGCAVG